MCSAAFAFRQSNHLSSSQRRFFHIIDMMVVGIVYTIALYVMISGGLKSVGKFAMTMVPFMCIFYILAGLFIMFRNAPQIPAMFKLVFDSAFNGTAAAGGFMGASVSLAINSGRKSTI